MVNQGKVTLAFNAIKVCFYIICVIVFLYSLIELILAYKEGTTSQSNGVQVFEELLKPAVTICPKEPFKNKKLAFESDKELFEETYSKEEIFADAMLEELMDTSKYICVLNLQTHLLYILKCNALLISYIESVAWVHELGIPQ